MVEPSNTKTIIEIKNKIKIGDILEIIIPGKIEPYKFTVNELWEEETNEKIEQINPGKLGQKVKIHVPINVEQDWIIRRKK